MGWKCRAGMFPHCTQLACAIRPVLFCRSTRIPRDSRIEYLQSLRMTYTATAYSLFHKNCNNFSNDFSTFLTGSGIPVRPPPAVHNSPALSHVGLSLDLTVHPYVLCACKTVALLRSYLDGNISSPPRSQACTVWHTLPQMSQMTSCRLRHLLSTDMMLHMYIHRLTS